MRIFRVILPAGDLEASVAFYSSVLEDSGWRVSPGRHYFDGGDVILAIVDPHADGDPWEPRPNFDHVYFSVTGLEAALARVTATGVPLDTPGERPGIAVRPWGERSFYAKDPFGNPICFVETGTEFTGRS
jgi:catechol 2,3-dioxygenase-like lactoylglutathione lyase family enzyme